MRKALSIVALSTLLASASAGAMSESSEERDAPVPAPAPQSAEIIRVAVYDEAPFGFLRPDGRYGGLMVEVWEIIAARLDLHYEYEAIDMAGLLTGLSDHRYQVGLGAITITPAREELVDFSQPVNASGTGIGVNRSSVVSRFSAYVWPISIAILKLAAGLALLLLMSGFIVWLVERRHEKDPGHRDIDTIEDGLWWSAVTISTIGYGDKVPHTRLGRIVGVVWIFAGLVMLSLFTANASAIFTVTMFESHIESEEDLRHARVGAARRSSGEEFLIRERIPYVAYENLHQAVDAVIAGDVDCVVSNVPVLRYVNRVDYGQKLTISQKWLLKNYMGIALEPDSPLKESIDRELLDLLARPEWQEKLAEYLG